MAEFKKGQRVRVTYEAKVTNAMNGKNPILLHVDDEEGWGHYLPPGATIEVIEEPYEEGAIYRCPLGCNWLYNARRDGDEPWVILYPNGGTDRRTREYVSDCGNLTKLVPSE